MLCLRRISLDAKSRLLFLSRSHSSTNDSMPKSTAISRLIHKKFLQQNGNNSPQAIFVFVQQRSLRTRPHALVQPVLKEMDKSAKDKDQKSKSGNLIDRAKSLNDLDRILPFEQPVSKKVWLIMQWGGSPLFTVLNNLGFGVFCACIMYTYGSFKEYYFVSRTNELKFGSGSSDEKLMNIFEKFLCATIRTDFELGLKIGVLLAVWTYRISWTKVPDRTSNKDKFSSDLYNSDAKDSKDEFKFGFGASGKKPKNEFEEDLYRRLHKKFEKKKEEEFEKFLRWFDPDKFVRRVPLYSLASGVGFAVLSYTIFFLMFRKHSWQAFITLLTFNTADAYFSARVHLRTIYGHKCLGK
ncbi:hypothetical protein Ddc_16370 [Ditylenchus destructor]|nr:hypothetical protein Ddc_16370 [Ditylenchus destructor]